MSGSSVLELLVMIEAGQRVGGLNSPWAWNYVVHGRWPDNFALQPGVG